MAGAWELVFGSGEASLQRQTRARLCEGGGASKLMVKRLDFVPIVVRISALGMLRIWEGY